MDADVSDTRHFRFFVLALFSSPFFAFPLAALALIFFCPLFPRRPRSPCPRLPAFVEIDGFTSCYGYWHR
eukprot:m.21053 g.21053  ORF g.21053 m.21053 type:complete len:70 (+) comp9016_c0_seq1:1857-2066(+)